MNEQTTVANTPEYNLNRPLPLWTESLREALRITGNIVSACKAIGIAPETVYGRLCWDTQLKASLAPDLEIGRQVSTEIARDVCYQRALAKSDNLLMFELKARLPHVYDDRMRMLPHLAKMSDDELLLRAKGLLLEAIATKALPATIAVTGHELVTDSYNDTETDQEGEGE